MRRGHWYTLFALSVILILSFALVYATGYSSSQPSHGTLYSDTIRGKSGSTVTVQDSLTVNSDPAVSVSYGKQVLAVSSDPSRAPLEVRMTNSANGNALTVFGNADITGYYDYALTIAVNGTIGGNNGGVFAGRKYTAAMTGTPERYIMLANATYAAYGSTDTGYSGLIAGLDPFAVGIAGVAGLASSTRGGSLGTTNYGVYGQYDASKKGYLGGAAYGAYGQFDLSNYGYLGSMNTGVYGRGTTYGVYGWSTGGAGTWAGYFTGGDGIYVSNHVYAHGAHLAGADLAEQYKSKDPIEAGDVVVIGSNTEVKRSTKAFDKKVVGVVSTDPGLLLNKDGDGYPLALSGKVPVKVSTENGAIAIGDLLTTSNTPGYAMKCKENDKCFGAVLGKALEPLSSGKGKILALISLG